MVAGLFARLDGDAAKANLRNHPVVEIDRKISLRSASGKAFVLGLLAAEPRRPSRLRELTFADDAFDTRAEPENDDRRAECAAALTLSKVCFSLTDQPAIGHALAIKLPGVRREDVLAADAETLHSFLLDEQAIQRLAAGDMDGFAVCRRRILTEYLERFVADRWGDRIDTRPSLRSILEDAAA